VSRRSKIGVLIAVVVLAGGTLVVSITADGRHVFATQHISAPRFCDAEMFIPGPFVNLVLTTRPPLNAPRSKVAPSSRSLARRSLG
jgi:hypothetical protein